MTSLIILIIFGFFKSGSSRGCIGVNENVPDPQLFNLKAGDIIIIDEAGNIRKK